MLHHARKVPESRPILVDVKIFEFAWSWMQNLIDPSP